MTADPKPTAPQKPRRRWLQFSLRTLLLVMIPIACLSAWVGNEYQRGQQEKKALAWVEEQGGSIEYHPAESPHNWRRRWLGSWFPQRSREVSVNRLMVVDGVVYSHIHDDGKPGMNIEPLVPLKSIETLDFSGTRLADLHPLALLPNLRALRLPYADIDNFDSLGELQTLEHLDLAYSPRQYISFRLNEPANQPRPPLDLSPVSQLTHLKTLRLDASNAHDFTPLAKLTNLEELYLTGTGITDLSPWPASRTCRSFT